MTILPAILIGGAVALVTSSRRRRRRRGGSSPSIEAGTPSVSKLPRSSDVVEMFQYDSLPDLIFSRPGESFGLSLLEGPAGSSWFLSSMPPSGEVSLVSKIRDDPGDGIGGKDIYLFRSENPGRGGIVFHFYEDATEFGQKSPDSRVEIHVKVE